MIRRLLLAATCLAAPLPAFAGEGMPQLDFANPLTISQIVWMALILAVLYAMLSSWALPGVESVLLMREQTITADLDASRSAKADADAASADVARAAAKARSEAQSAINDAVNAAKAEAAARAATQNARLEKQLTEAEQSIAAARASAMAALREVATDTARDIIGRITGTAPDPGAIDAAVSGALGSRGLG